MPRLQREKNLLLKINKISSRDKYSPIIRMDDFAFPLKNGSATTCINNILKRKK
jgi:hypothetical protein